MNPQPDLPVSPDDFVGRKQQIAVFRQALQQGLTAGRTSSFAALGEWGIGKTSLPLKFAALCSEPEFAMLPVFISASSDMHDYLRFAETLLGGFADACLSRQTCKLGCEESFKTGDSNAQIIGKADLAMTLRDQFQSFGVEGMNYSFWFSADSDYFPETKGPADPGTAVLYKTASGAVYRARDQRIRTLGLRTSVGHTAIIAAWLRGETLGHPYFIAFVCRHLAVIESEIRPDKLETIWPAIFDQLRREKFRPDILQLSVKELDLIHRFTSLGTGEFRASQFGGKFQREYFARLVEKRLLIRTKRGRYKLYHPLFREFLRQTR